MGILCFFLPSSSSTASVSFSPILSLLSRDVSCVGAPGGGVEGPGGHVGRGRSSSTCTGSLGQQAGQAGEEVHVLEKPLHVGQVLQQGPEVGLGERNGGVGLFQMKLEGVGGKQTMKYAPL